MDHTYNLLVARLVETLDSGQGSGRFNRIFELMYRHKHKLMPNVDVEEGHRLSKSQRRELDISERAYYLASPEARFNVISDLMLSSEGLINLFTLATYRRYVQM